MDTVTFVRDRKWEGTNARTLEMPVDKLAASIVCRWAMLADERFAGYVLPEPLQSLYFTMLAVHDDDPPQAAWDAFMDDLWHAVERMRLEERADMFIRFHDPATIKTHYWTHDGVDYLDAAHTLPRED